MKRHSLATVQVEVPCQNTAHPSLEPKSLKCLISTSKYGKQIHPQIVKMVKRLLKKFFRGAKISGTFHITIGLP